VKRRVAALLALPAIAALLAGCSSGSSSSSSASDKVEVMSWWVSPSEKAALQTLVSAFEKQHPGVTLVDSSVTGGAGANEQVALSSRLLNNDPPDLWQTFPGKSLAAWKSAGDIDDVSSVYQKTGLASEIPKTLLDTLTIDGKQWAVPTEAHRQNNLFYNTAVLKKAGVALPASGYTMDQFATDLAKVNATGTPGLCVGGSDRFTSVEIFEDTLLSQVGADGWSQISQDRFDWGGPQVKAALTTYGSIMKNADPEASGMTWDQAARAFASGGCGFLVMNDSVYGEVTKAGAKPGKDFGYVAYPGTEGNYLAIVDDFVSAADAKNTAGGMKFLQTIASPSVETAFSAKKGSVPLRRDAAVSTLSSYQQAAYKSLWNDKILLSMTDGELIDPKLQQSLFNAVADFTQSGSQSSFINTMQNSSAVVPVTGG
jgi:glucose/mannose transport system substrate-binding protein